MIATIALVALLATAPQPPSVPELVAETGPSLRDHLGGGSERFRIVSTLLGETRQLFVHLPQSYGKTAASRRYPLIIAFDGESLLLPLVTTSESLTQAGQIPECVVVSIENTDRLRDLTPPGISVSGSSLHEGGDRFLDFIERELIPALDARFRTEAPRILVGHSSGGILLTYAAATRETFRFALALDTPMHLGDGWLEKKMLERAGASTAPLRYVSMEAVYGWTGPSWTRFQGAAPKSWRLHREHLEHESHNSMRLLASYLGLRELFHDYSMQSAPQYPTTSILPAYDRLTADYGAAVIPPLQLLRQVVDDLMMEGRGAAAHAAFDTIVRSYGEPADAADLRAQIAEVERRPPPAETVESLLATPFPSPAEMRPFLGDWEGSMWMSPDDRTPATLRLVAEGDRVSGTFTTRPGPDFVDVQPLQYLRVTRSGFTFGFMNGMRPRGMLMHVGVLDGDRLAGEIVFGGINVVHPDGSPVPTIRFELRKKGQAQ